MEDQIIDPDHPAYLSLRREFEDDELWCKSAGWDFNTVCVILEHYGCTIGEKLDAYSAVTWHKDLKGSSVPLPCVEMLDRDTIERVLDLIEKAKGIPATGTRNPRK